MFRNTGLSVVIVTTGISGLVIVPVTISIVVITTVSIFASMISVVGNVIPVHLCYEWRSGRDGRVINGRTTVWDIWPGKY